MAGKLPAIVLFHNYFSPSSEQIEQCILAHKSEQPTAGDMAIFHKYWLYIKHENPWNPWGMLLIYQNACLWTIEYNILSFMFKDI